jgi:lipopolysaccharide biosynthesis glycosyltransferase
MAVSGRNRLIFFTTDAGFLLPTLQAATQIRRQSAVCAIADLAIFLVGMEADDIARVRAAFEPEGILFFELDPSAYSLPDGATFNAGHVPPSTLARLTVADRVPTHYEHLVYIDGDTQIVGDLLPLVSHDVAPGKILAATDHNIACSSPTGKYGRTLRDYVQSLGIVNTELYFNAGVLAFRRETWRDIGPAALAFMRKNSALCKFHDQSALNAICDGRREVMHPAFNYAPAYHLTGQRRFGPSIIHFIGSSKPWQSNCTLWLGRWFETYRQLVEAHPFLAMFWKQEGGTPIVRGTGMKARFQNYIKRYRLAGYMAKAPFAVRPAGSDAALA